MPDHNSSHTNKALGLVGKNKLWWMIPTFSTLVLVGIFVWGMQINSDTSKDSLVVLSFAPPLESLAELNANERASVTATIDGREFELEIAQSEEQQRRGLGQRDSIGQNSGMLFVFKQADLHGIWMKDMRFAIDIFWLDKKGEVVDYANNVEPDSYPQVFSPTSRAWYVVEIPAASWEPSR